MHRITSPLCMMTSSNGNIFRVTGPLWGEFTGHRWIPLTRPVTRSFGVLFDLHLNNSRDAGDMRRHCAHYDVTIMCVRVGYGYGAWVIRNLPVYRGFPSLKMIIHGLCRRITSPFWSNNRISFCKYIAMIEDCPVTETNVANDGMVPSHFWFIYLV